MRGKSLSLAIIRMVARISGFGANATCLESENTGLLITGRAAEETAVRFDKVRLGYLIHGAWQAETVVLLAH
jgi:hypothetical protein